MANAATSMMTDLGVLQTDPSLLELAYQMQQAQQNPAFSFLGFSPWNEVGTLNPSMQSILDQYGKTDAFNPNFYSPTVVDPGIPGVVGPGTLTGGLPAPPGWDLNEIVPTTPVERGPDLDPLTGQPTVPDIALSQTPLGSPGIDYTLGSTPYTTGGPAPTGFAPANASGAFTVVDPATGQPVTVGPAGFNPIDAQAVTVGPAGFNTIDAQAPTGPAGPTIDTTGPTIDTGPGTFDPNATGGGDFQKQYRDLLRRVGLLPGIEGGPEGSSPPPSDTITPVQDVAARTTAPQQNRTDPAMDDALRKLVAAAGTASSPGFGSPASLAAISGPGSVAANQ